MVFGRFADRGCDGLCVCVSCASVSVRAIFTVSLILGIRSVVYLAICALVSAELRRAPRRRRPAAVTSGHCPPATGGPPLVIPRGRGRSVVADAPSVPARVTLAARGETPRCTESGEAPA